MAASTTVARYLFQRLQQVGVQHVFGVPGDFTLRALDHIRAVGSRFVVNCNELNAGYAADGYARTRGFAAIFTTYGVGELSAINATAGSYAEHVPLVHVVGLPQRHLIKSGAVVHHTLGDGDTRVFHHMHRKVTAARVLLEHPDKAAEQIDQAIGMAISESRPSYIALPCDMANEEINAQQLSNKIRLPRPSNPATSEAYEMLLQRLRQARQPLLLVDRGMGMDNMRVEIDKFVRQSGIPTLTMPSGASMIDHRIENYFGVHAGPVGQTDTMPAVLSSDLVLAFGPMFSDTQTLGFSAVPDACKTITLHKNYIQFPGDERRVTTDTRQILRQLTENFAETSLSNNTAASLTQSSFRDFPIITSLANGPDPQINQSKLYLRLNSYLRAQDIILLANATPILGGRDFVLPDPSCRVIVSGLWFSIGHMLPAALGAALAQQTSRDPIARRGRVVLFDGDGSFQVTAQELSTIIHHRLNMTIFIVNNAGYAYERLIHNPEADYHDIAPWDYLSLPRVFGAEQAIRKASEEGEEYMVETTTLRTWDDVEAFLIDERFGNGFGGKGKRGLRLIDIRVGRTDVPEKFKQVFESAGRNLG